METKPKNREWVKNAAIIFLAVLLVLTFFSNTIMNKSLAQVATANVTSGTITAKVRGTGTVTADGAYQVTAEQTREVRSVFIKAGSEVNAGDVLFILGEGSSEEIEAAQEELRQLQLSYQRTSISAGSDYTAQEREIQKAQEKLTAAEDTEEEARIACENASQVPEDERKAAEEKLNAAKGALARLTQEHDDAVEQAYEDVAAALETYQEISDKYPDPEAMTDDEKAELEQAKLDLEKAQNYYDELSNSADPAIIAAQTAVDKYQNEYDTMMGRAGAYSEAYERAVAYTQECLEKLMDLEDALEDQKGADSRSQALAALELQDLAYQIDKQKEKLAELSGGAENQIIAKVSGTVESVECMAGQKVPAGNIMCTINVPDMGYSLSFTVTKDQAKRLHVGDTATVSNYYWGSTITATLDSITTDPKNPQNNKILNFSLEGNVNVGSELTISVGQKSASYDHIIPNNAIRNDSNGSFVLVVDAKNSPLGNKYIARRVNIEVLAEDDVNSAVTGDLNYGDFVITTSGAPVKSGDQVRLADS